MAVVAQCTAEVRSYVKDEVYMQQWRCSKKRLQVNVVTDGGSGGIVHYDSGVIMLTRAHMQHAYTGERAPQPCVWG